MLSNISRAEAQEVNMYQTNPEEGELVRYLVFYWNEYVKGPNVGCARENCFIFYEGPPSVEKWKEAKYVASQLTK